jgi:NDP-sugar pyrophosphorylase family protein
MFRAEVFDFFPKPGTSKAARPDDAGEFADWAMDVFPALLENDVPFYSHEIEAYWNDIGNLEELREGNLDALRGEVGLDLGGDVVDGVRTGAAASEEGPPGAPVLLGPGCEIGDDVRIDGPSVIGAGARVGDGCRLREVIVLSGADIPARSVLAGAIAAKRGD